MMISPIRFGTDIAKIMASEKAITAPSETDDPITTMIQNKILYEYSAVLLLPNKYIQA
jgi:hypothetical protein